MLPQTVSYLITSEEVRVVVICSGLVKGRITHLYLSTGKLSICMGISILPSMIVHQNITHYSAWCIVELLLDKRLPVSKIATSQSVSVRENFVFVVDLSRLEKPEDIRVDDLGSWTCNGKRCLQCVVDDGVVSEILSESKVRTGNTYCLVKRFHKHATAGDFKRTIAKI